MLAIHGLAGCGKGADESVAEDKARAERARALAQAELDADQKTFGRIATGELRVPSAGGRAEEPKTTVTAARPPTEAAVASAATAIAARSAESVFAEVAPRVTRVHAMDASGRVVSMGSGVVIDRAVVLTNCHVTARAARLSVKIGDAVMPATIQLADEELDLCRLSVPGLAAPPVAIGTVESLRTGQRVFAVGAPQGLELTISDGIVSALRKVDGGTVIQTTAPISPGSSGGGLFDTSGRLVGIMTFQSRYGQNLNFALPADWIGRMRARVATATSSRGTFLPDRAADSAPRTLILGDWLCRDWTSGGTGRYGFAPDGTVSVATSDGRATMLRYRIEGKVLLLADASQGFTVTIQELTAARMVLHGREKSIACER